MEKKKLILKEGAHPNYLATICKIGHTFPIEGADKIQRTVINDWDMVISKDMTEGQTVVYFPVETAICEKFLSANNLYEISEWDKNANAGEVGLLINKANALKEEGKLDEATDILSEAKKMVGFFNKAGRVRILHLRGCASMGFIAKPESIVNAYPELADTDWESLVGTKFNYIGDEEFCWKFIPPVKEAPVRDSQRNYKKNLRKIKRFDRLVPDTFYPHYDTKMLNGCMSLMNPDDDVTMSVKVHGTSIVLANIPVKRELSRWEKIKKFFGLYVEETKYDVVYSSHHVIQNQYINTGKGEGFYGDNIYAHVNRDFGKFIPKDTTIYGEIAGYQEGLSTMLQKNHDYGCKVGEWKFMPYRIVSKVNGKDRFEWNVSEVREWTDKLISDHPEIADKVLPINIVYRGKFRSLYPDIPVDENWHENVLARMKTDTEHFGMELKEPMCHLYEAEAAAAKRVLDLAIQNNESAKTIKKLQKDYEKWEGLRPPREGIVIRKDNDPMAEAWKLKTAAHYNLEKAQHDAGETDIEETA